MTTEDRRLLTGGVWGAILGTVIGYLLGWVIRQRGPELFGALPREDRSFT